MALPRAPLKTLAAIAAQPGARWVLLWAAVARIHLGGLGLAVLLLTEEATGSLAVAGTATGVLSLGVGLTRPLQGRLIDRFGFGALTVVAVAHLVCGSGFVAVMAGGGQATIAVFAAAVLGLSAPAVSVATSIVWARDFTPTEQPAVFGLDIALQSLAFAVGPLIAGGLAASTSPSLAVGVLLAVGVPPAVALAATRSEVRSTDRGRRREPFGAVGSPLLTSVGLGVVYGASGVAVVAGVLALDSAGWAGPVSAALFAGGVLGDLWLAPRRAEVPVAVRLRSRVGAVAVCAAVLCATPNVLWLGVGVVVLGAVLASAWVTVVLEVRERATVGRRGEAFGWAGAALRVGNAVGAAAGGVLADSADYRAAMALAVLGAGMALAAPPLLHAGGRLRRLSRPPRLPGAPTRRPRSFGSRRPGSVRA